MSSSVSDKEFSECVKNTEGFFTEKGGKQIAKHEWGKRGLAYDIKGQSEGRYTVYVYEIRPDYIKEIDNSMRLEKNVLRHMIIATPPEFEIIDWGKWFKEWLEKRDEEKERKEEEDREEEKKKIIKKVSKKASVEKTEKKPEAKSEPTPDIENKLEEIISDEDLNL